MDALQERSYVTKRLKGYIYHPPPWYHKVDKAQNVEHGFECNSTILTVMSGEGVGMSELTILKMNYQPSSSFTQLLAVQGTSDQINETLYFLMFSILEYLQKLDKYKD